MTRFVGTPLRGIEFSSPSDEAVSARVNGDGQPRIRIDAGGRITWSSGSASGDTNLYRDSADLLTTDDVFKATGGLVTITTSGAPTAPLPDGAIAVDSTNGEFYFRSGGAWTQVTGGGGGSGASITISDSEPSGASVGDLWFESDTGSTYVYYDSFWVEIGGVGLTTGGSSDLDGLTDVVITSPTTGQVLKFNGTDWVNDTDNAGTTITSLDDIGDVSTPAPASGSFLMWDGFQWKDQSIELGNNTTGNYVSGVTAGTGVTVTHTPAEGSSPTIAIGQAVGTTDSPSFSGVTANTINLSGANGSIRFEGVNVDGKATILEFTEPTNTRQIVFPDAGGTVALLGSISLGTDTTGNYVSDIAAGTGVTVTHTPGEGSSAEIAIGQDVSITAIPQFGGVSIVNEGSERGSIGNFGLDIQLESQSDMYITSQGGDVTIKAWGNEFEDGVATIDADQIQLNGPITTNSNLSVGGNLTVSGTTTTINTENLLVEDNVITLNSNAPGPTVAYAGIEVYRGPAFPTPTIRWSEPDSSWQFSNDGSVYSNFANAPVYDSVQAVLAGQIFG